MPVASVVPGLDDRVPQTQESAVADVPSPSPWPRPEPGRAPLPLVVDCDGCEVRGLACDDCVVSVLLGPPPERLSLDADELSALDALAGAGLVPPLRLVQAVDPLPDDDPDGPDNLDDSHRPHHPE